MPKDAGHGTTSAGTVTLVTLANWHGAIEVISRGNDVFWVRTDGADPTVAGDECEWIGANSSNIIPNRSEPSDQGAGLRNTTEVRILCASAIAYTVAGR